MLRCCWGRPGTCRQAHTVAGCSRRCSVFHVVPCKALIESVVQAFEEVAQRTSTVPFLAVLEGRQQLPPDYYREFLRLPYATITALTVGTYFAHPLMQWASAKLPW